MIIRNSHGQYFHTSKWGSYPINDGNPENDVEDFDEEKWQDKQDEMREAEADRNEE